MGRVRLTTTANPAWLVRCDQCIVSTTLLDHFTTFFPLLLVFLFSNLRKIEKWDKSGVLNLANNSHYNYTPTHD